MNLIFYKRKYILLAEAVHPINPLVYFCISSAVFILELFKINFTKIFSR